MRLNQANERRGVILMVVLSLLTLFAIVGISFVLYADAEAASARVAREGETDQRADMKPEECLAMFLGQLIYDVNDDIQGVGSGLRGHSLARNMYGYYYASGTATYQNATITMSNTSNLVQGSTIVVSMNADPDLTLTGIITSISQNASITLNTVWPYGPGTAAVTIKVPNTVPYNGTGRLHTDGTNWPYMNLWSLDDHSLVNYTWFPSDGILRDPERYAPANPQDPQAPPSLRPSPITLQTGYFVGSNPPYTYPDLNNFFLAAVRSDGTVLAPSFHRPWLFNSGTTLNDMTNANWTNAQGKYYTLRPRPNEHPSFPLPDDGVGDVKNLPWSTTNDSIWIDIGAPVMTAPDGTKYKMLVAPCIIDLDNRINLGAAGNIEGNNTASRSNQGWFPSEVNLGTLWSSSANNSAEWLNLFLNKALNNQTYYGKYGANSGPSGVLFPQGSAAHVYAQTDLDGRNEQNSGIATTGIQLPGTNASAPANIPFPFFPIGYGSGSNTERANHPAAYAVYKSSLTTATSTNDDNAFRPSDMEALLRPSSTGSQPVDSGSSALISNLIRLCPNSLGTGTLTPQRRNWITTISSDLGCPGLSPWIYNPNTAASTVLPYSTYTVNTATPQLPPIGNFSGGVGTGLTYPTFADRKQANQSGSDFTTNWRAGDAAQVLGSALGKIDLNRPLPPFPHMSSGTTPMLTKTANDRYDNAANSAMALTVQNQFNSAMTARVTLANDIYRRLLAVTGVAPVQPANLLSPLVTDLAPRRWLAQLAVNIVDYIDADEISTPFNFYTAADAGSQTFNIYQVTPTVSTIPAWPSGNPDVPTYWVFGTELPKVVINEVLAEYTYPTATTFNVNVWVELLNTMPTATSVSNTATINGSTLQPLDSLSVPLYMATPTGTTAPIYNPYQLVIANNNTTAYANGLWFNSVTGVNNNVTGTQQQLRNVCNFQTGTGTVPTVQNPTTPGYQIAWVGGGGGGLPGQTWMLVGPNASLNAQAYNDYNGDITAANVTAAGGTPANVPWLQSPHMSYQGQVAAGNQWQASGTTTSIYDNVSGISVTLRRLTNPHLPPNPFTAGGGLTNPALPPNPYITVDYANGIKLNGYPTPQPNNPPSPSSFGKLQPFAANLTLTAGNQVDTTSSQYVAQTPNPPIGTPNQHTLGSPNAPLANPFMWLVHLDRKLVSPMELLHISGFHPHELTQRFILGMNAKTNNPPVSQPYNYSPLPTNVPTGTATNPTMCFQHYVPWFDYTRRLYRFFEMVDTHDGASGIGPVNSRIPGKININTLWDYPQTLAASQTPPYPAQNLMCLALADPPASSANADNPNFTAANVSTIFRNLLKLRTPNIDQVMPSLTQADRPFLGMGAGYTGPDPQYPSNYGFPNPNGNDINHTLFTSATSGTWPTVAGTNGQGPQLQLPTNTPTGPAVTTTHPYLQNELLTKIYSRLTTRSNVFAVFLTVGFFQVTGTVTGAPNIPQLGAEIGRSEGRQIRHRMFAIVDRTNLQVFPTLTTASSVSVSGSATISLPASNTVPPFTNPTIIPGSNGTQQFLSIINAGTLVTGVIQVGTQLVIEPGTANEETITVTAVNSTATPPTFTANFTLQHPNAAVTGNSSRAYSIIQRGNPGPPWQRYDPRLDPAVPYFSIID